jgi:hypothetical protein
VDDEGAEGYRVGGYHPVCVEGWKNRLEFRVMCTVPGRVIRVGISSLTDWN